MKSKDEATLDTLRTLLDATEGLLGRIDRSEHEAFASGVEGELEARRRELAESFELASPYI